MIAVGQSLDLTQWGREHYQTAYNDWIAAGLSLLLIAAVGLALRVRRLPLPANAILGVGGITYPLYLLHQHIGYMVFNAVGDAVPPLPLAGATAAVMVLLAWTVWRYIERPGQRLLKTLLSLAVSYWTEVLALRRAQHSRRS